MCDGKGRGADSLAEAEEVVEKGSDRVHHTGKGGWKPKTRKGNTCKSRVCFCCRAWMGVTQIAGTLKNLQQFWRNEKTIPIKDIKSSRTSLLMRIISTSHTIKESYLPSETVIDSSSTIHIQTACVGAMLSAFGRASNGMLVQKPLSWITISWPRNWYLFRN